MNDVVIEKKLGCNQGGQFFFNAYEASEKKSVSSKSKYQGLNLIFDELRHHRCCQIPHFSVKITAMATKLHSVGLSEVPEGPGCGLLRDGPG